jgi:hypothetical protein
MRKRPAALWLAMAAALLVFPTARGEAQDASTIVELPARNSYARVLIYHPADLAHRQDNPYGWLRESFAYGPEAAEGRILGFNAEIEGVVRLTTGGLSEREHRWKGQPWTFRYQVRHGKAFVGTEDSLQYVDHGEPWRNFKPLPDNGFELANGAYAVTVYPIDWAAEPGGMMDDRRRTAGALPDLVIVFKRVDDLHAIEATLGPVDFPYFVRGKPSLPAKISPLAWTQSRLEQTAPDLGQQAHVVVGAPSTPLVSGFLQTVVDADNVRATIKARRIARPPLVLAPEAREGALAVAVGGIMAYEGPHSHDPAVRLTVECGPLVRLGRVWREHGLTWAQVEPVSRPPSTVSASELAALKQEIEDAARRSRPFRKRLLEGSWVRGFLVASTRMLRARMGKPDTLDVALARREAALASDDRAFRAGFYELDRMQSMTSAEALTTWLLYMLDVPAKRGLELLARSDADRLVELRRLIAALD